MAQLCNHMRVYPCEKCTDEILEKKDVKITTLTERAEKAEQAEQALVEERAMHKKAEDNLWARIGELEEQMVLRYSGKPRPILYTDTINGQQVCVDNLWAVTTEELNRLALLEKVDSELRGAISDAMSDTENLVHLEKLGGNIVKEEHAKGVLLALRLVREFMERSPGVPLAALKEGK